MPAGHSASGAQDEGSAPERDRLRMAVAVALAETLPSNMTLEGYMDSLQQTLISPPPQSSSSTTPSPQSSGTARPVPPAINIVVLVKRLENLETRVSKLEKCLKSRDEAGHQTS